MPSVDAGVLYDFGGLRIHSTFDLPWLVAIRDAPGPKGPGQHERSGGLHEQRSADVDISLSTAPPPSGRHVRTLPGHYRLALEACGDDWVIRHDDESVTIADAGRTLRCHCPDPARLPLLAEIIVRRVLPRLSVFHGRLPIHAATLADGSGAVMLLGSSGAGKSTMTAALALHCGWDIFSDDMSVLGDEGRHVAFPTVPGVSVWQQSRDALGLAPEDCLPLHSREGKVWYSPRMAGPLPPQPLEVVILLSFDSDGGGIACKRLAGPSVLVGLSSQLVPFNGRDAGEIAGLMERFNRMGAAVPIYGLAYPRDYRALPDVVNTIRRLRTGAIS